jgi:hypothetical protein
LLPDIVKSAEEEVTSLEGPDREYAMFTGEVDITARLIPFEVLKSVVMVDCRSLAKKLSIS